MIHLKFNFDTQLLKYYRKVVKNNDFAQSRIAFTKYVVVLSSEKESLRKGKMTCFNLISTVFPILTQRREKSEESRKQNIK